MTYSTLTYTKQSIRANPVPALREQAGSGLEITIKTASPPADIMGVENQKNVYDLVRGYDNPSLGWESYQVKELIKTETQNWVYNLADWKSFISLTFREEKTPDVAMSLFKWFIRQNNEHAFGKHYSRRVGHSYFSYFFGLEYQTRDVVHFHALVDKPIDFSFVHKVWGERCGFAWIDGSLKNKKAVVDYVCKYCVKGGQVDQFVQKKNYVPDPLPAWWKDEHYKVVQLGGAPASQGGGVACLDKLWQFLKECKVSNLT